MPEYSFGQAIVSLNLCGCFQLRTTNWSINWRACSENPSLSSPRKKIRNICIYFKSEYLVLPIPDKMKYVHFSLLKRPQDLRNNTAVSSLDFLFASLDPRLAAMQLTCPEAGNPEMSMGTDKNRPKESLLFFNQRTWKVQPGRVETSLIKMTLFQINKTRLFLNPSEGCPGSLGFHCHLVLSPLLFHMDSNS